MRKLVLRCQRLGEGAPTMLLMELKTTSQLPGSNVGGAFASRPLKRVPLRPFPHIFALKPGETPGGLLVGRPLSDHSWLMSGSSSSGWGACSARASCSNSLALRKSVLVSSTSETQCS